MLIRSLPHLDPIEALWQPIKFHPENRREATGVDRAAEDQQQPLETEPAARLNCSQRTEFAVEHIARESIVNLRVR
jgi:hypothetical protein